MKFLAGYVGCIGILIVMVGLLFHSIVLPRIRHRIGHFLDRIVMAVFGLVMLRCMAVKPDGGDALRNPRTIPPRQLSEPADRTESATMTNAPPWEAALAFRAIEATSSNVLFIAAWPRGCYDYDPTFDLFVAQPQLTNDWQWIASQTAMPGETNRMFTITPSMLGLDELPPSLFARVTERNEACAEMGDFDNDGVPNPYELHHGTNPYVDDANLIGKLAVGASEESNDICVSLLNNNLPTSIAPAKLLPENYRDYIGTGIGLPILMLDQEEHAIVAELASLPSQGGYSSGYSPISSLRNRYYEPIIEGDSGNPCFLVYGNGLIILHTFHYGNGGSGPFFSNYAMEIQAIMDSLSSSKGKNLKRLSFAEFTDCQRIVREVK